MSQWPERSLRTLTVYYERGLKALEELRAERFEEADHLLNLRKAAFHNFRAADHLALQVGYPEVIDQEMRRMWPLISKLDDDLMDELTLARAKTESQMVQLKKVRATLGRFRSSDGTGPRFAKSV